MKFKLIVILLIFSAKALSQDAAVILNNKNLAFQIFKMIRARDTSHEILEMPLPFIITTKDSTRITFLGLVPSGTINYPVYNNVFAKETNSLDGVFSNALSYHFADSFFCYSGVANVSNDSLYVQINEIKNNNFKFNNFLSQLNTDKTLFKGKANEIEVPINNQLLKRSIKLYFKEDYAVICTPDFKPSYKDLIPNQSKDILQKLGQESFLLIIDTSVISKYISPSLSYNELKIETVKFKYTDSTVNISCAISGKFEGYKLANKYNLNLDLSSSLLLIKNTGVRILSGNNQAEFKILKTKLSEWTITNNGNSIQYYNPAKERNINLYGKVFQILLDIPYSFYYKDNFYFYCTYLNKTL